MQRPVGAAFDPEYMMERVPHSERVSLWGCFCGRGVGQAEIFVGEFNAKRYVDILQHNLLQTDGASFLPTGALVVSARQCTSTQS